MKIIPFLKKNYNKLLDEIYKFIKNAFIQKIILFCIFTSSFLLFIASIIVSFKYSKYTWFFLPWIICFSTIPCFFIAMSLFFFKNLDLFDYFLQKLYTIFIKPWLLPIIVILFCLGFYFLYFWFNLPHIYYFIVMLPIIPIYLIKIVFQFYSTSSRFNSSAWAVLFSLIIIIPLMVYFFNFIGKKILSNNSNDRDKKDLYILKRFDKVKINFKKPNLKQKIFLIWCFSAIICFFSLYNSYFGWDTPYYYVYVKDYQKTGNLNLSLDQKLGYMNFPVVIVLIFFTFLCGGDIILGSVLMHTIIFSLMPPFIILTTFNITKDDRIALWAGIIFMFSGSVQMLLTGIMKQLLSILIIIIALYILSYESKKKWKNNIARFTAYSLIIIQSVFYIFFLSLIYLITTQYFLRKKKIDFYFLKNEFIFRVFKLFIFFIIIVILIFFFLFGFGSNFITRIFSIPLNIYTYSIRNTFSYSFLNILSFVLFAGLIGIILIFIIIGIHFDYKNKVIHNKKLRAFLIIFFECTFIFVFLGIFGFNVIRYRMICYSSIPVSIFGAIGICKVKEIFPKIWIKKRNIQKFLGLTILSLLISSYFLGITYIRNGCAIPEEIVAIDWFKSRDDYDKLKNENKTDIQIICNDHLIYWIQYKIHHNALIKNNYISSLNDLDVERLKDNYYRKFLRKRAVEKLYIFISKNSEHFSEQSDFNNLTEFFEEYRIYYNFNWNKYTINEVVTIWEISYV